MKLISIDLKSNFGFFKKPDINDSIYLTYNMIHKPALLGMLGAVLGLEGHKEHGSLPDYYIELQEKRNLRIGIQPIGQGQKNGNFAKTIVKYNNSTGQANEGTLNVIEQILIKPEYRIYLELDENEKLCKNLLRKLKNYESVFIPYLGKNDFPCWWENFSDYRKVSNVNSDGVKIRTIFCKIHDSKLKDLKEQMPFGFMAGLMEKTETIFFQFERLPTSFNKELKQYDEPEKFIYTNMKFKKDMFSDDESFKQLENGDGIYLF
jgi:CRISPR-associated protein Cas5h